MRKEKKIKTVGKLLKSLRVDPIFLLRVLHEITGCQPILLDYQVNPVPRYGYGKPPHPKLYSIIDRNRVAYKNTLESILTFSPSFLKISSENQVNSQEPSWINQWLPGLDSVTLYSLLSIRNPKDYLEIGSGNSTKFVRRAIIDQGLRTKITSIDPCPRAEIDLICDNIIRQPLEAIDLSLFDRLDSGDFLYVDGSHRCFTNSDVTVLFLDILPNLKRGIFVEFHDISLPYDYSASFAERYYSEQYLLAVQILAENDKLNIVMPNAFISEDSELSNILTPLWEKPTMRAVPRFGCSFWFQTI